MPTADEQLVIQATGGNTRAFEELVRRHQRYVFNLCLRALSDYDLANEMAQEVFLRAWRSLGSFRGDARFTTWLYTIAHNLCMNRLAGLQRDARHQASEEEAGGLAQLHSREEDPALQYERKERQTSIHRHIEALPARYRIVITLFYLQEMSYHEIAEVTGLPIGTVKTHLFRAKEMLRRAMEDGTPPEPMATDGTRAERVEGAGGDLPGGASCLLQPLQAGTGALASIGGRPAFLPDGGRAR